MQYTTSIHICVDGTMSLCDSEGKREGGREEEEREREREREVVVVAFLQ